MIIYPAQAQRVVSLHCVSKRDFTIIDRKLLKMDLQIFKNNFSYAYSWHNWLSNNH